METLIFWGCLAGPVWGLTKQPQRRLWWVVFLRVLSFRAVSGVEHGDRQRKSVCRKAEDVLWCGDAGQKVLAVRQTQTNTSASVCMSECCARTVAMLIARHLKCTVLGLCAHPDSPPSLSCSLMSLSPSVYRLKADNREETAGGFIFNLFNRAARGEGSASLGRGGVGGLAAGDRKSVV